MQACSWLRLGTPLPGETVRSNDDARQPSWEVAFSGLGTAYMGKQDGRVWAMFWHGSGQATGFWFRPSDLRDPVALLAAIRESREPVVRHLAGRLRLVQRRECAAQVGAKEMAAWLRESLCFDLNHCLEDHRLTWPKDRAGAALQRLLTDHERRWLKKTRWDQQPEVLGRYVIEDLFPGLIAHAAPERGPLSKDDLARLADECLARYGVRPPATYVRLECSAGLAYEERVGGVPAYSELTMQMGSWSGLPVDYFAPLEPVVVSTTPKLAQASAVAAAHQRAARFVGQASTKAEASLVLGYGPSREQSARGPQCLLWRVQVPVGRIRGPDDDPTRPQAKLDPKVLMVDIDAQTGAIVAEDIRLEKTEPSKENRPGGLPEALPDNATWRQEAATAAEAVTR